MRWELRCWKLLLPLHVVQSNLYAFHYEFLLRTSKVWNLSARLSS